MTVVLRDAMTFLSKDIDAIVGAISYENPLNANTTLTINAGNKVITLLQNMPMTKCKLDGKEFGFIFKSTGYYANNNDKDFNKWNQGTKRMLRRELKPCFSNERDTRHGLAQ